MTKSLLSQVTYAMETSECLLPHMAYLLQDLPSLSGADDDVIEVLSELNFPKGGTILDLGCGRGDLTVRLARIFDSEVTGFDAHQPFIDIAQKLAHAANLSQRCRFVAADLRQALSEPIQYDAVLMIAIGSVLGGPAETMRALRTSVSDGGWIVIDNAYLEDGIPPSANLDDYLNLTETEAGLTQDGDTIVAWRIRSPAGKVYNALALEAIPKRAATLAKKYPELEGELDQYVAGQFEEIAMMDGPVVPALWVIRKAGI